VRLRREVVWWRWFGPTGTAVARAAVVRPASRTPGTTADIGPTGDARRTGTPTAASPPGPSTPLSEPLSQGGTVGGVSTDTTSPGESAEPLVVPPDTPRRSGPIRGEVRHDG